MLIWILGLFILSFVLYVKLYVFRLTRGAVLKNKKISKDLKLSLLFKISKYYQVTALLIILITLITFFLVQYN